MTTTNLKFNNYDLGELFASDTGNSTYTGYFPSLSSIDTYSGTQNTLKGSNNVGYSINGSDIVSVFHPIYHDHDDHGSSHTSTTIDIPEWCSKVGFVLQARGGKGGPAFTNYWQKINIPLRNQYANQNYNVLTFNFSNQNATFWDSKNYVYNRRVGIKCWYDRYASGTNYGRTYGANYAASYGANYTTNYFRNAVENATYYGSGGGGGGCCAGVYTIDPNNRISSMVHSTSESYGYCQLYFDSDEYVISYTGNDSVENTNITSSNNPQYFQNSDTDNTSKDTQGSGGSFTIMSNTNKLTTRFGSDGSSGTTTTGQTNNSGGSSGYANSPEILSHFMPNFEQVKGSGATGSSNTSYTDIDNMHLRYWFIR